MGDNVASSSSSKIAKGEPCVPSEVESVPCRISVHPFFSKPKPSEEGDASSSSTGFRWHESLGPKKTLLYGTNGNPNNLPSSLSSTITQTETETSIDAQILGDLEKVEVREKFLVVNEKVTPKAKEKVKVAAFDLDGTIIEGNGRTVSADWKFWKSGVKSKLEAVVAEG